MSLVYEMLDLFHLARRSQTIGEQDGQMANMSSAVTTLGRDVAILLRGGHQFDYAQSLDMMPQTYHIFIVARMSLR